ncbi:MAG: riboflavin biosynthesis protein RibF [Holophagales bacterium]|jgi:riboflavin kinase/FMN adenylyltransferase|nr:riboflavin biosynthesis protein RibF [Holophagales bacterium]
MQVWKADFFSARAEKLQQGPSVATLGNFDGVHAGHRQLLAKAVHSAKGRSLPTVLVTFDPHPEKMLSPAPGAALLMTMQQKLDVFERLGIDCVWAVPFDREFSELAPCTFLDGLCEAISPTDLHVGRAFRFGRGRAGDIDLIKEWAADNDCLVHPHAYKAIDGGALSSSRIRRALLDGEVGLASELLGGPYVLSGVVVEGERVGRKLGFPTANLRWDQELLPAPGVYVTSVHCPPSLSSPSLGLTCVGTKPTFAGRPPTVETHLPGKDMNLYGSIMELEFLHKLRGEIAFENVSELATQIAEDVKNGLEWWKSSGRCK